MKNVFYNQGMMDMFRSDRHAIAIFTASFCFSMFFFNFIEGGILLPSAKPSTVTFGADSFAGATNPANGVSVGDRFDLDVIWEHDRKRATVINNPIPGANGHYNASRTKDFYFPGGAINKTFESEICCKKIKWALGLIAYTPFFCKTTYNKAVPIWGTSHLGVDLLAGVISPVLAVQLNEKHAVGLSVSVHFLRVKVNGLEILDFAPITASPGFLTNKGYGYSVGVAPSFGWRWQVTKKLSFGLSYFTKIRMSSLKKYKGWQPDHGREDTLPKIIAGLGYNFTKKLLGFFDVQWLGWHELPVGNPTFGNPKPIGAKGGPSYGWRSQYLFATGFGYSVSEMIYVRGAFLHYRTATKRSQTYTNMESCDTVENQLILGATYTFCKSNEFSVYYSHSFEKKIKGIHNGIPAVFGGGEVNLKSSIDQVCIGYGHKF